MIKRLLVILSVISILTGSCKTMKTISVDLANPAKEDPGEHIQSLTLVNRAIDKRFTDDPADSIQLRFFKKQFVVDTVIYDLKSADTLMQALGNLLFESGRYDIVIPENRFLVRDTVAYISEPLSWENTVRYNTIFKTDAVLSLEHFRTSVLTSYYETSSYDVNSDQFYTSSVAEMEISYVALFRLYDPAERENLRSFLISDTLQWEDSDPSIKQLFRRFTPVKNALAEAGIHAAFRLTNEVAPIWKPARRTYFEKGHPLLRETGLLVEEYNWDDAEGIWKDLLENTKSKSLRSKLEFNIALACEMAGNLNEAIRWGLQSYKTMYRPATYRYLEILKKRKSLLEKQDEKI
jgi:hypothetical protein